MKKSLFIIIALIGTLLCSVSIFAYDSTEVEYDVFYQNPDYPNSSSQRYIILDQTPLTDMYYNIADTITVGYSFNTLVPYYADGDHVSFFASFMVTIPRINFQGSDNRWIGDYSLYCGPWNYRTGLLYSDGLQSTLLFSLRDLVYNNYSVQQKTGTFYWQSIADCSYKALIYHGGSAAFQSLSSEYETFFINIQFDLNITQNLELLPFNLCVYQNVEAAGSVPFYRVDAKPFFRLNDTSMYGLLEQIKASIDSLDFSALADLSQLSTTISNIYNEVYRQNELIEDLIEDTSPDPDITRFNEEANALKSEAAELHSIENGLYGTIADFTFPAVQDQSVTSSMFTEWLQDNLILTLLVVSLCFMLVFSFI